MNDRSGPRCGRTSVIRPETRQTKPTHSSRELWSLTHRSGHLTLHNKMSWQRTHDQQHWEDWPHRQMRREQQQPQSHLCTDLPRQKQGSRLLGVWKCLPQQFQVLHLHCGQSIPLQNHGASAWISGAARNLGGVIRGKVP